MTAKQPPMEALITDSTYWVVQTKLYPPQVRDTLAPRRRLLDALAQSVLANRLTLLCAPAGYGKTTLLASLAQARPDLPTAWLSLDQEENDPVQFLAALISALQRLQRACGVAAQLRLPACVGPAGRPAGEIRRVTGLLINDILTHLPEPFVLALDDLHLVTEPATLDALDYLLEHLPPQMHVVIATRHEPPLALARLRARGQLADLRLADLRFTLDETGLLLNDVLGLNLAPADLAALHAATEGWACGLSLLASSIERLPSAPSRQGLFAGLGASRHVFDYLASEVLDRQTPDVRDFLLQTSILAELTPASCQAVTGRADAEAVLEVLYRRNLFVVAVDEPGLWDAASPVGSPAPVGPPAGLSAEPAPASRLGRPAAMCRSYRYHALFAEFLQARLQRGRPALLRELHARAARSQANPARAIGHYLAAEMWAEAAASIEAVWLRYLHQGLVDTVITWIEALPESTRDAFPWMWHAIGSCYLQYGDIVTSQVQLERAVECWERVGDHESQQSSIGTLSILAFVRCDWAYLQRLVDRGLPLSGSPYGRARLRLSSAWLALFVKHAPAAAEADINAALDACYEADEADPLIAVAFYLMQGLAVSAAGARRLEALCLDTRARFGPGLSTVQLTADDNLAYVYFRRGQLARAVEAAERALDLREVNGGYPMQGMSALWIAASAHTALGNYAAAERGFALYKSEIDMVERNGQLAAWGQYPLARIRWLQGRAADVRQFYATMRAFGAERETPLAALLRLMLNGLVEMLDGHPAAAEAALRRACEMEREVPLATIFGSPRLLLAHLYRSTRRTRAALALFGPLLAECAAEDKAGVIVQEGSHAVALLRLAIENSVHADYAARLLELLAAPPCAPAVAVPETGATLTPREVEVLLLLAAGASNPAIAAQLTISLATAKSHVAHILAKLGVATRAQAAAWARDHSIL